MTRATGPSRPPTPLRRSFGHAWDGLAAAAATQRNMRIHLVAAVLAGAFAAAAPLSYAERALVVLCMALVVAAEAANTALEALVDLRGGPPSEPARLAKDAAAGGVLALAAASVAVLALVAAPHLGELVRAWRSLLVPGLAGAGLAALTSAALGRRPGGDRAVIPIAAAGVVLVALLGLTARCPACALLPAAPFAVAVAVGKRRSAPSRRRARRPVPRAAPQRALAGRAPQGSRPE